MNEESGQDEAISQAEHAWITLFRIRDDVAKESPNACGQLSKAAKDALEDLLCKPDTQLCQVLSLSGKHVNHRVLRELFLTDQEDLVQIDQCLTRHECVYTCLLGVTRPFS